MSEAATKTTKKTYTLDDIANTLGLSRVTVWRMRERGDLPDPDIGKDSATRPLWFNRTIEPFLPS